MAKKKEKAPGKEKSKAKAKKKKINIKEFFVLNCEKMLLIAIIPLALYIAYCGTLYQPLRWQPDELQRISQEADQHVKTNVRKASDENVTIFPFDTYAEWIKREIRPELYRTEIQWLPSLFPEKNKRPGLGPNQLFSVRNLKAAAGLGALAITPLNVGGASTPRINSGGEGAGMGPERVGKRWVVVTGLIPIKDQLNVYIDAYSRSVQPDSMRDTPLYWLYEVERAEIEPGMADDALPWKKIDFIPTFRRDSLEWGNFSMDPIDPGYLAPSAPGAFPMAYPLPPVERPFGEEVVHAPAIPMMTETQVQAMKEAEKYQEQMDKLRLDMRQEDYLDQDPFGGSMGGSMSMGGGEGMGSGRAGLGGGGGGGGGANSARQRREVARMSETVKTVEVANYLYRFFDFNVEPGKTYRYRVRLYLANPNYQLPPNVLEDESLNKKRQIVTDFSDPSNRVTVPLEARILVTNVSAPTARTPWTEPDASVMAVHFEVKDGSEWCVELDRVYRGSTINIANKEGKNYRQDINLNAANQGMMGESGMPMPRPGTGTGRRPTTGAAGRQTVTDTSKKTINVRSDVCVVDIFGGTALRKTGDAPDMRSPGKLLVLEPSGNLVIREVSADLIEVEQLKNPVTTGGGMGMGMGGMGMSEM